MRKILKKEDVKASLAGEKNLDRVPCCYTMWYIPWVFKPMAMMKTMLSRFKYPDDIATCGWHDLRWYFFAMDERYGSHLRCEISGVMEGGAPTVKRKYRKEGLGMDGHVLLEDMTKVDEVIAKMPDPKKATLLFHMPSKRYKVAWLFSVFFENHWTIRGMENTLMDFYLYPDEVKRLYRAMCDYHKGIIKRCKEELHADAVFFGDDMGTQNGPFFSPEIFREFFFPLWKEMIDYAHSLGLQVWLHSCGDVTLFIPMFIEAGLDVLHPIQKYAMDQEKVFEEYHDKIGFFYGFDVQQVIPFGTADEVEAECKRTMDLFSQAKGRLVYTAGNAFAGDCKPECFDRLMKVSHTYNPYKNRKNK